MTEEQGGKEGINGNQFNICRCRKIGEEAVAAPIGTSLTWIDKNGYKGYSYRDESAGSMAFSAYSKVYI